MNTASIQVRNWIQYKVFFCKRWSATSCVVGRPNQFAAAALRSHNKFRELHHSPPLSWSDVLAAQATQIAYDLVKNFSEESKRSDVADKADEEDNESVGENVEKLLGVRYGCDSSAALTATEKWYREGQNFSYSYPLIQERTNSFTQLLWVGTDRVGMGCALRRGLLNNDVFVVALYSPPGNTDGAITRNVLAPGRVKATSDVYSNIFRRNKIKNGRSWGTKLLVYRLHWRSRD